MSTIEKLSQKITNEEVFEGLIQGLDYPANFAAAFVPITAKPLRNYPWWLRREYYRKSEGVYPESTSVLDACNQMYPYLAVHVSKEDKNFIAYTPDRNSGENDRQIKTTLGKFLMKYYPHYPDHTIGELVADHLGDMDNTFLMASGPEITSLYLENGADDNGACMSKGAEMYAGCDGHHPTEIYDAPNIFMAYLRDSEGKISARAMVYHASETDKRIIRVYLNQVLKRKLIRSGYKVGAWHGAQFKTIPVGPKSGKVQRYVVPYLDGEGAAGSAERSSVAVIGGKLTSINTATAAKLADKFGSSAYVQAVNTTGYYNLQDIPEKEIYRTCQLTGESINMLTDDTVTYYHNGEFIEVKKTAATTAFMGRARKTVGGSLQKVWAAEGTPEFRDPGTGYQTIDDDLQRKAAGCRKLDPRYYSAEEAAGWIDRDAWRYSNEYVQSGDFLLRSGDSVQAITVSEADRAKGVISAVHNQEIGKDWVKVHARTKGENIYAAPDVVIHRTRNGRKVVKGVHIVHQSVKSGIWDFQRSMTQHSMFGDTFWLLNTETPVDITQERAIAAVRRMLASEMADGYDLNAAVGLLVRRRISDYLRIDNRYLYDYPTTGTPSWERIKMQNKDLCENSDIGKAITYVLAVMSAEAEAIDYNGQHVNTAPVEAASPVTLAELQSVLPEAVAVPEAVRAAPWAPVAAPSPEDWRNNTVIGTQAINTIVNFA